MNYVQIAKDIRAAAKACIAEERKLDRSGYFTHRAVEIIACDEDGRAHSGDPVFLELREVSGKKIEQAFLEALRDAENVAAPFTSFGVCGGTDRYDSLNDKMNDYDYCPWTGTWDLEYDITTGEKR